MTRTEYESIKAVDKLVTEASKEITTLTGTVFTKTMLTRITNSIIRYSLYTFKRNGLFINDPNVYVQDLAGISDEAISSLRWIGSKSEPVIKRARELAKERLGGTKE